MSGKSWHHIAKKMNNILKETKRIHKFDLVDRLSISLSLYEKYKPWYEYHYTEYARYDKPTKNWVLIEIEFENNKE